MTARWILNLLLLLVLGLLGLLIQQELERMRARPTLAGSGLPPPHLIEIIRQGEPRIRLERLAAGWRMREPWDVDADQQRIDALLAIREAPLLRSIPISATEPGELGELGLDPVRLRLRLDTTEIAIGGLDPIAQWRYVASDDLVHLIPDHFHHLLIAPPIEMVARTLLPRDPVWVFVTRDGIALSEQTLNRLADLSAERLEPMASDPLTGPSVDARVELGAADGTRLRYRVSPDGRRWSRPDLGLTYVLEVAPELVEAPGPLAPDPLASDPLAWPSAADARAGAAEDPAALQTQLEDGAADQSRSLMDPDAPLSGQLPLGPPPEVKLRPRELEREVADEPPRAPTSPLREAPHGFGLDPFAPDPQ
ncbi:MAG: hypothetical protein EOM91_05540 [Sphingobacteriia bacterium]|nr:hypothetical protein [Sphingobacteriia bacterium]NCC38595.1 hypothetical protein [Gammaproteobacteria bacterium]